jgi:phage terminase large subunit-like protein
LGQNPKESFSDVGHLTKTVSSFEDGCRAYNYLYDQRLHVFQVFVQEFFGRHIDVTKLFEPGGHELFEHLLLALLRSKHNRQDRLKIRTKNLYAQVLALGHSLSVEASSIFFWLLRHILEGNQSHELFPQTTTVEKIIERSVFSNKNNVYQDLPLNVTCSISRVIAVEKLKKEEWYWDMTVFGTHNYVTEDGAVNHNSGKSECSVMELLWLCLGTHPYHQRSIPIKAKIYFESYGTVSEVFEPKIMKWLPQKYLSQKKPFIRNQHGDLTGINFLNGSFIRVGTYDQQESKSEGSDWDIVVFDEPPPRPLYIANLRGVVDRGGLIWFAMTPLKEVWIYDELWVPGSSGKKPHVETFSWSTYDNPHIPKDEIDILVSELTQAEIDVRIYGKFKKLQGLVIDTYDAELSDIEPFDLDENFSIYEGIDPHPRKANTVLWKAIDKDGFRIVCRELACEKGIYDTGKEIARIRKELTAHGATLIRSIADSSLNQKDLAFKINQKDELNRSLIEEGETVMPETALKKDWLLPGIQKLRDLYRATNLIEGKYYPTEYVFNNCPRYKYELLHYQWSEKVGDDAKPISLNNDLLDPNRYIESIAPKFVTPGQSQFIRNNSGAYHRKRGMEIYLPNRK